VIEEGPHPGSFIYKTMDRVTGEVVKQLPREQVVDLMQDAQKYSSGSVINTTA
jgi:flagellar protein FlaG